MTGSVHGHQGEGMSRVLILMVLVGLSSPVAAQECLTTEEARAAVNEHHLLDFQQAARLSRSKVRGEVISANLCRLNHRFMYVLGILSPEGRVARIGVDAANSSVQEMR